MVDYRALPYQFPPRKPVSAAGKMLTINPHLTPASYYAPSVTSSSSSSSHVRRRTSSSGNQPPHSSDGTYYPPPHLSPAAPLNDPPSPVMKRRQDSSSTATTASNGPPSSSGVSIHLRRSASTNTSGSSQGFATSAYVATLRKQKATVWCERSQPEDARLLAAQRAAKQRASTEVVGSSSTLTKGRHGVDVGNGSANSSMRGKGGRLGRGSSNLSSASNAGIGTGTVVGGPPTRLYLGDSSDEEDSYIPGPGLQRRSGSGHSSNNSNSNRRKSTYRNSAMYNEQRSSSHGPPQRRTSTGSSGSYSPNTSSAELGPPQGLRPKSRSPPSLVSPHILEETSPEMRQVSSDYFTSEQVGMPGADKDTLKRRGSVDESEARTMTMSGLRLVVANPD